MNQLLFRLAAIPVLLCATSSLCQGQLIVVRPGYVKAPFVRVYRHPDGSSTVRAPFVNVDSPARSPRAVHPRIERTPTREALAELDLQRPHRGLRQTAAEFEDQLSRFPTGEVWMAHFQTRTILELARTDAQSRPTSDEQAKLVEILHIFDAAAERFELRAIHRLASYRALHSALREYVTPTEQAAPRREVLPTPLPLIPRR